MIIDEVQTIPKFLLPNLSLYLGCLVDKYNSTILLVSATVPQEVKDLPMLKYSRRKWKDSYLRLTSKRIEFKAAFDVSLEVPFSGVMSVYFLWLILGEKLVNSTGYIATQI